MLSFSRLLYSRQVWHLLPHTVSPLSIPFLSFLLMSTRLVPDLAQEYTSTVSNSAQLNSNRQQKLSNLFLINIVASHGFPLYYHNLLPRAPIIPPARGQTGVHKHCAKLHRRSIHLRDDAKMYNFPRPEKIEVAKHIFHAEKHIVYLAHLTSPSSTLSWETREGRSCSSNVKLEPQYLQIFEI